MVGGGLIFIYRDTMFVAYACDMYGIVQPMYGNNQLVTINQNGADGKSDTTIQYTLQNNASSMLCILYISYS